MASVQICSFSVVIMICTCFELGLSESSRNAVTKYGRGYCNRNHSRIVCNYIPKDLPAGIETVRLLNVDGNQYPDETLRKGTFSSENWRYVKELEVTSEEQWLEHHNTIGVFDSLCFVELESLEKLHISIANNFKFKSGTLSKLVNLKFLDLVQCRRFDIDDLINSLNQSDSVTNLQRLNISYLNSYRQGLTLTDTFFKLISYNKIKELDMRGIQVLFINLTAFFENCGTLENIYLSKMILSDFSYDYIPRHCSNLKYLDASYVLLPSEMIATWGNVKTISNIVVPFNFIWTWLKFLIQTEHLNLSGIIPKETSYILENVTIFLQGTSEFRLKTLILRNNNFERLNMTIISHNCMLQSIDFSNCKIRFLHPGLLSSFTALTSIDLSNNHLNEMMAEDAVLFGRLFLKLSNLRDVNLSGNDLTQLPRDIFKSNSELEVIDLSDNMLAQIPFDTSPLKRIMFLILTRNRIKKLNDVSMARLGGLLSVRNTANKDFHMPPLDLKENPISCSDCNSLTFLDWIMKSKFLSKIKCFNENSEYVFLNSKVIKHVQELCERPKVIIISCIASALSILLAVVVAISIRYYRRKQKNKNEMEERIALIREGAGQHEFVVFLSFSSKDDVFVENYVIRSLNEHLQNRIGVARDLVCNGDRHFQLGRPIHDQISELLKKSSVVVVVLTDNYSSSVHCRNEFGQAFMLEKPIVLMVNDQVDTELMTPLIRDIYEKKTRVLWKYENGNYVLKTSWENVCSSIIELVDG